MTRTAPFDWLLESNQPSVRFRTLTELLGISKRDPRVRGAQNSILKIGWAADLLRQRSPGSGWQEGSSQYVPKYISTHWKMLVLADLGLTKDTPSIREACEYWMKGFAVTEGRLGGNSKGTPHFCVSANMVRALIRFGYEDDARVRHTLEWLTETADPKGGWSCWGTGRNLDSWEALSAFAVYPRSKWTAKMHSAVEKGVEFFLERELHRQGSRYAPWYRFHYPIHYYYDLLVGLEVVTSLGYASDRRLNYALSILRRRRRPDGRWNLDATHPDVEGGLATWFQKHPAIPWALEAVGKPSKMITLRALNVLARVDEPSPIR